MSSLVKFIRGEIEFRNCTKLQCLGLVLILLLKKSQQRKLLKAIIILFSLKVFQNCYKVHKFIKSHEKYVENIIQQNMKKYNDKDAIAHTYDKVANKAQLNENIQYIKANYHPKGGCIPPDKDAYRVHPESRNFFAGGRAAILQIAHPMVAVAVKEHSYIIKAQGKGFKRKEYDPELMSKSLKKRFHNTFAQLFPMGYGDMDRAIKATKRVFQIHSHIKGTFTTESITKESSIFYNKPYHALMLNPLIWVWATLIESQMYMYSMFNDEPLYTYNLSKNNKLYKYKNKLYQTAFNFGLLFGLKTTDLPSNINEFEKYYYYDMIRMNSKHIEMCMESNMWVNIFFMNKKWYLKPAIFLLESSTAVMLPKNVRKKINDENKNLLKFNSIYHISGCFGLGLSKTIYNMLPDSVRQLNEFIDMQKRVYGKEYGHIDQALIKASGHFANFVVAIST